jgi:LPS export ABC transporter protein LptC
MHISRSQSLFLAIGLLACFFVAGSFLVKTRTTKSNTATTSPLPTAPKVPPRSKIVLQNFQRSETKNGRKVWEITAARGEFFPEDSLISLKTALLKLFQEDGELVTLRAPKALVTLEGNSLVKAVASGGVTITKGETLTMDTQRATYDKANGTISSKEVVTFKGKGFTIIGTGLEGNVTAKEFLLKKDVKSVFLKKGIEESTNRDTL